MGNPLDVQVGGDHYTKYKYQPIEFINDLDLGFILILRKPIGHEVPMGGKQLPPWLNNIFLYQKILLYLCYEIDVENKTFAY